MKARVFFIALALILMGFFLWTSPARATTISEVAGTGVCYTGISGGKTLNESVISGDRIVVIATMTAAIGGITNISLGTTLYASFTKELEYTGIRNIQIWTATVDSTQSANVSWTMGGSGAACVSWVEYSGISSFGAASETNVTAGPTGDANITASISAPDVMHAGFGNLSGSTTTVIPLNGVLVANTTSDPSNVRSLGAGYRNGTSGTATWGIVYGAPSGTLEMVEIRLVGSFADPMISTGAASLITATTVRLNGSLSATGDCALPMDYGIDYQPAPLVGGAGFVHDTVGSTSAPLNFFDAPSGLSPSTLYEYRAFATCDLGTFHGAILNFTTLSLASVTTVAASSILTTAADLNGEVTALGDCAHPVNLSFDWGTSPTLAAFTNDYVIGTSGAPLAFSETVSTLSPGTTYYFRGNATCDLGTALGAILNFTTTTTPPTVSTGGATSINTTIAVIHATLSSMGTATTVFYGFLWGTDPGLAGAMNDTVASTAAPLNYQEGLGPLTPGTTYYFQAWALGDGFVTGAIHNFTTLAEPSVTTGGSYDAAPGSVVINGSLDSLGDSTHPVVVGFRWGTNATLATFTNASVIPTNAPLLFNEGLSGLTPGTTYYFRAWANGSTGFVLGAIHNFTPAQWPPIVATLNVTAFGTTNLRLAGTVSSVGTYSVVLVGFFYGTDPTLVNYTLVVMGNVTHVGKFTLNVGNLTQGTTYYYRAWAFAGGAYVNGSILNATTLIPPPTGTMLSSSPSSPSLRR